VSLWTCLLEGATLVGTALELAVMEWAAGVYRPVLLLVVQT